MIWVSSNFLALLFSVQCWQFCSVLYLNNAQQRNMSPPFWCLPNLFLKSVVKLIPSSLRGGSQWSVADGTRKAFDDNSPSHSVGEPFPPQIRVNYSWDPEMRSAPSIHPFTHSTPLFTFQPQPLFFPLDESSSNFQLRKSKIQRRKQTFRTPSDTKPRYQKLQRKPPGKYASLFYN